MKSKTYQTITIDTPHLVCYRSEDGDGINREYLILLDDSTLQEVNLKNNSQVRYENKQGELDEHKDPSIMAQAGFKPCSKHAYLKAQDALKERRTLAHSRLSQKRHHQGAIAQAMEVLEQPRSIRA